MQLSYICHYIVSIPIIITQQKIYSHNFKAKDRRGRKAVSESVELVYIESTSYLGDGYSEGTSCSTKWAQRRGNIKGKQYKPEPSDT